MSPDGTMSYIDAQGNILGQDTSSPLSILADSLLGDTTQPEGIAAPYASCWWWIDEYPTYYW